MIDECEEPRAEWELDPDRSRGSHRCHNDRSDIDTSHMCAWEDEQKIQTSLWWSCTVHPQQRICQDMRSLRMFILKFEVRSPKDRIACESRSMSSPGATALTYPSPFTPTQSFALTPHRDLVPRIRAQTSAEISSNACTMTIHKAINTSMNLHSIRATSSHIYKNDFNETQTIPASILFPPTLISHQCFLTPLPILGTDHME